MSNETGMEIGIWSVDGHLSCEQSIVAPGETAVVASIGDPGGGETATTGNMWIDVGDFHPRIKIRKPKLKNAEILDKETYTVEVSGTNDYPETGSVYSKSLTIHVGG
ncbi:MAG: hypothetical protein ABL874_02970 [Sphingopyxis sp.]